MGRFTTLVRSFVLLRCPRCARGRMFEGWFRMRSACPACALPFQTEAGDITGGMGFNIVLTMVLFLIGFITLLIAGVNPGTQMAIWLPFMLLFPIFFYPFSRALWTAILYLTGELERKASQDEQV